MKTIHAFAALAALIIVTQAPAFASDEQVEVRSYSVDEAAALNLDGLMTADSLDQEAMTGTQAESADLGAVEQMRPRRPIVIVRPPVVVVRPPVVIVPAPYHRYYTCFARSRFGSVFSATGYGSASQIQRRAVNSCRYSSRGCVATGCR